MAAAALSTILGALPVFLLGALGVLIRRDLDFSQVQFGLAVSAYFTVSALASVPAGRAAQSLGAWYTTVLAALLSAGALLGVAVAVTSFPGLLIALAVAGTGSALAQIGSNDALARGVPSSRQGLAFGVKQAAVLGASLIAGLTLPLVALPLGWRPTFALAAGMALVYVLVAPGPRSRPSGSTRRTGGRADVPLPVLVVIGAAAALGAGSANAMGAFLVDYAIAEGRGASSAGLLLAGGSALGVVVRLVVGWLADARSRGHLAVVAAMLAGGSAGMLFIAAGGPALAVGAALAFGLGWSWPGLLNFTVVRLNPTAPAVATSIIQTGAFTGGALGPLTFGFGVAGASYAVAWCAAGVAMLAAAVMLLVARRLLSAQGGQGAQGASGIQGELAEAPPVRQLSD